MKKINITIIVVLLLISNACIVICTNNSTPDVPIYPESILVDEVSRETNDDLVYIYYYTSTASSEEIINFYTADGAQCHRTSGLKAGQVCTGDANPVGTYSVGIDLESDGSESLTKYYINISWDRCGDDFDFVEPL